MMDELFTFRVLQYRHDAWIGEALNVGLLLSAPSHNFLKLKVRSARGRILKAYPGMDASDFRLTLKALETQAASIASKKSMPDLLTEFPSASTASQDLLVDDDSALRWGQSGSGTLTDPENDLNRLFSRYVSRWEAEDRRENRSDEDVYATFAKALKEYHAQISMEERVVNTGKFGSLKFRHTFQNGSLHIVQPLSFDAANEDYLFDKASRWHGNLVRLQGTENVRTHIVVGPPTNSQLSAAFQGAVQLLKAAPGQPEIVEEAEARHLVRRLVSASHGGGIHWS